MSFAAGTAPTPRRVRLVPSWPSSSRFPTSGNVHNLDYFGDKKKIVVERATDEGYEVIECPLPALVSVTEGIMAERFPSRQELEAARASPDIEEVAAAQLSSDSSLFGAAGSPTWVSEIRLIEPSRLGHVIEEADPHVAAKMVVDIVERRSVTAAPVEVAGPRLRYRGQRDMAIWVLAERLGSGLRRATFELLGKARELAERTRGEVSAIVMGPAQEDDLRSLGAYGADRVLVLGSTDLGHPAGLAATAAFSEAIGAHSPYAVLVPSTVNGRDLASRVAARLGLGLTGDCVDLEINEGGELVQLKPALGGNIIAPIRSRTRPYMATLRPGLLTPLEPDWDQKAEVEILEVPAAAGGADIVLLESHSQQDVMGVELETTQVVLGVGMGVGGPENLPTVYKLARSLGASVAATRNVTDAGWLPKQLQVGLTGRAIAPELYLAVGVRGDFNHTVGLQKAGTILAINVNPNPRRAPILQAADVSIIGDWETYLPPLVEALVPLVESRATKVRG